MCFTNLVHDTDIVMATIGPWSGSKVWEYAMCWKHGKNHEIVKITLREGDISSKIKDNDVMRSWTMSSELLDGCGKESLTD